MWKTTTRHLTSQIFELAGIVLSQLVLLTAREHPSSSSTTVGPGGQTAGPLLVLTGHIGAAAALGLEQWAFFPDLLASTLPSAPVLPLLLPFFCHAFLHLQPLIAMEHLHRTTFFQHLPFLCFLGLDLMRGHVAREPSPLGCYLLRGSHSRWSGAGHFS